MKNKDRRFNGNVIWRFLARRSFSKTAREGVFMKAERDILEEYENADMARRLHLYLQFPDYREGFLVQDLKVLKYEKKAPLTFCQTRKTVKKSREPGRWRKFFIHGFACR
jgi:hypothetical protein